jgi:glycosyltransferase involved in cell wall biosynthesis
MMSTPTLSLLIPAYNAAAYLPRLLESARAQTVPFDEIWVYDDCSTDNTAEVAVALGAKVLRGDINKGCSAGKDALARLVETDWIHFHDADDELMPNFVSLAHKWIKENRFDVVLFDYEYVDFETKELLATRRFDRAKLENDPKAYAILEQINAICGLYRRSAYLAADGYDLDPKVLYNEDVAFHIRLAFSGLTFSAESEVSIRNYRFSNSMSVSNYRKCGDAHYHVMLKTLQLDADKAYRKLVAIKLWNATAVLASCNSWQNAFGAAELAANYAPPPKDATNSVFRLLASINPKLAVSFREYWIRATKPTLRPFLKS